MTASLSPPPSPTVGAAPRWQIVATVNGPGEISAWLFPFAAALAARAPEVRLCAALLPCVFATGCEPRVLAETPGVAAYFLPRDSTAAILRGRRPPAFDPQRPGLLLHLGGEPILALLLGRRLGYPCLAYAEHRLPFQSRFQRVFLTDPLPGGSDRNGRCQVLGNMMVDAARMRCPVRRPTRLAPPTVGIFTGSRDYMVKHMLPFFVKVAGHVAARRPEVRWLLGKADYVTLPMLADSAGIPAGRLIESENARLLPGAPFGTLLSERGVRIEVLTPGKVMETADLVLTIPGTNTAELTALGIPMIVLVPTYYPEVHPLPGVLGHLDRIPLLGRYLKRGCALAYHRHVRYLAHPNRKRRRAVVPEITGKITTHEVAEALLAQFERPLAPVEEELLSIMGPPGAATRLVDEVLTWLRSQVPA